MRNHYYFQLLTIVVLGISLITGCSSGGSRTNPVVPDENQQITDLTTEREIESAENRHFLMFYNMIYVDPTDPENPTFEIVPVRATSIHLNILKLLEVGPCTDCFKITGLVKLEPLHFNIDIEITHPMADPIFTVFDCRVIIMFNGSRTFPESGLTMSDNTMGDAEFLDPDGYTTLYNSTTLGVAPNDFFGYFEGEIATPELPGATLNGYRRYITDDPANTRNALYDGDTVTNTIELILGPNPFALGYAVDACWAPPIDEPVDDPMTDFGPEANCEEPWKIEAADIVSGLSEGGGSTTLQIDVYDWQGNSTHADPVVECPDLFTGSAMASWVSDGTGYSRYEAVIANSNLAPGGDYIVLVGVEANENDPIAQPWLDLTAYQLVDVTVGTGTVINFPDENLEQAIRDAIGKPTGDIYQADLYGLTTLAAGGMGISDLEGIQYCVDLENIGFGGNTIATIDQLASLNSLTNLGLVDNQIADLTPLSGLLNLTDLEIDNNLVIDLTPLQNLTNLIDLEVDSNQITDVTPIEGLVNLSQLNLSSNMITDIGPIAGAPPGFGTGVEIWLDYNPLDCDSINVHIPALQANGVTVNYAEPEIVFPDANLNNAIHIELGIPGMDPIYQSHLCGFTSLNAGGIGAADIEGLQYCVDLETLDLSAGTISDISQLQGLTSLTELKISGNNISDITPLQNLTNMETLWMNNNNISDITSLQNLTHLMDLQLDTNSITNLTPISALTTLIDLRVRWNNIPDITPLQNLTNLQILMLQGCSFGDITPLQGMSSLNWLNLIACSISDISPLQGLTTLTTISLHNNSISDLGPLQNLTNLASLDLSANNITNLEPLTLNPGLGGGDNLWVELNPLDCDSLTVHIPFLQGLGVTVSYEDPEVNFPDPGLDTAMHTTLGKLPGDPIYQSELCGLTTVTASSMAISNLEGLQYCINLTLLSLNYNAIVDISQLQYLVNLETLEITNNLITDLSPLAGLTNLWHLDFTDNQVADITPLQGIIGLHELYFENNQVVDLAPLQALWNLDVIIFHNNLVTDLIPLQNLTDLGGLGLDQNQVGSLTPLTGLLNLEYLSVWDNLISDLSPLQDLINLTELDLAGNLITDLAPLVANTGFGVGDEIWIEDNPLTCEALQIQIPALIATGAIVNFNDPVITFPDPGLDLAVRIELGIPVADIHQTDLCGMVNLSANAFAISNLEGIQYCTELLSLNLNSNSITDITLLQYLDKLLVLSLTGNQITDITQLQNLTSLQVLSLNFNLISDITPLTNLTNIYSLSMINLNGGGPIGSLDPLSGLVLLDNIRLVNNQIADISALVPLTFLNTVYLESNIIEDVSPLEFLTNITTLELDYNLIRDISPIAANPGMGPGDSLWLINNPLDCDAHSVHIPALQAAGVFVNFSDPVVTFPDPALNAIIHGTLGIPIPNDIYRTDLCGLTTLSADGLGISDITGMEYCTELTYLRLTNNNITDITQLGECTKLESLYLYTNNITDIAPLQNCPLLEKVHINGNSVSDLSPLSGLANLATLEFFGNNVTDITPLGTIPSLVTIQMGGNNVPDISPLQYLTNLEVLQAGGCQIIDMSPVQYLVNLNELWINNNLIVDISAVETLINVGTIAVYDNAGIVDAEPLWNCHTGGSGLSTVYVGGTGLMPGDPWLDLLIADGVTVNF